MRSARSLLATFSLAVVVSGSLLAQQGASLDGEWRAYGRDLANTKYSPLNQIVASKFERLQVR